MKHHTELADRFFPQSLYPRHERHSSKHIATGYRMFQGIFDSLKRIKDMPSLALDQRILR